MMSISSPKPMESDGGGVGIVGTQESAFQGRSQFIPMDIQI